MAIFANLCAARYVDKTFTVNLSPQLPISGWLMRFMVQESFGGLSGYIQKWCGSGTSISGQSGITITNALQGAFRIALNSPDTSGMNYGNFSYTVERLDSGYHTVLSLGYFVVTPSEG